MIETRDERERWLLTAVPMVILYTCVARLAESAVSWRVRTLTY